MAQQKRINEELTTRTIDKGDDCSWARSGVVSSCVPGTLVEVVVVNVVTKSRMAAVVDAVDVITTVIVVQVVVVVTRVFMPNADVCIAPIAMLVDVVAFVKPVMLGVIVSLILVVIGDVVVVVGDISKICIGSRRFAACGMRVTVTSLAVSATAATAADTLCDVVVVVAIAVAVVFAVLAAVDALDAIDVVDITMGAGISNCGTSVIGFAAALGTVVTYTLLVVSFNDAVSGTAVASRSAGKRLLELVD